jgi:ATP-binding cassette subfamily C protein CydC
MRPRLDGWARLLAASLVGACAAGAGIGLTATAGWLIARAAEHPNVAVLGVAIAGVRFFGISRGFLRYAERLAGHDAALRSLAALRARLYGCLERLAPSGIATFRSGDLLARLVDDVDSAQDLMLRAVAPYVVSAVAGAAAVGLLVWLLPVAGLVLAVALLLAGTAVPALSGWLVRRGEARQAETRGRFTTGVVDLLGGAPDLVVLGADTRQLQLVDRLDDQLTRQARAAARTAGVGTGLTTLLAGLACCGVLAVGVVAVAAGTLTSRLLVVVALVPLAVAELMTVLPGAAATLVRSRRSLARVADVLETAEPVADQDRPAPVPAAPYTLRVRGMGTRYRPDAPWALRGVDLDLSPGRLVAVVGGSGAGKSSLAAVLVRFLDPAEGEVTLNGVPLDALAGDAVRRVVGLCPQDAHVFDTTIAENLRLARPDATDGQVRDALATVGLLSWVDSLPNRSGTPVGEHGNRLSGGQRQRLVVARTLLAEPSVLLLDEPTEHLDVTAADAWMATLPRIAAGRPTLVISHRLTGLESADETVVLDHGRVVERGRHEDLLRLDGTYARMWAREQGFPAQRIPISSVPDDALDTAGN